jgi:aspartyl/glutamyl-tRNA(Asn/Gln) amidotransferase C subunit
MAPGGENPVPTDLASLFALARLRLDPTRRDELTTRLAAVIEAFASLAAVDTSGAASHEDAERAPLRPDTIGPVLCPAEALANTTHRAADCFVVPRVVEG